MKPEIRKQLDAILDRQQEQKRASAIQVDEQHKAEAKSLTDYEAMKEKIIRPSFQEIVETYGSKGVHLRIEDQGEHPGEKGGMGLPNIRIDMAQMYPSASRDMRPEFRLSFQKGNRSVSLYTSTGHQSGPRGSIALDAITADWIHAEFLKFQSGGF
jgi:hypothetical protein